MVRRSLVQRRKEHVKTPLTIAVVTLTMSSSLICQTGTKPVPTKWLNDGRLVVAELNFSIKSPTSDAKWSYTGDLPKVNGSGSTAFVVELGDGSRFVVNVIENSSKMQSTNGDQFIIGMRKTFPKDWHIQDSRFEVSDVPLKDSRKFKVTIGLPSGSTYYAYGYIVSGNRSYQTITFSPSPSEPIPFTQFAQSFTLLRASANAPLPNFCGIFLLWALWGAIANWRYVKRGGVKATRGEKLGGLAAVGLGLAVIGFLGAQGASAESVGSMTATVGSLIFSLWEFSRWRARRKSPLPIPNFQEPKPQKGTAYTESELGIMRSGNDDSSFG
jgi:hypothetical protein